MCGPCGVLAQRGPNCGKTEPRQGRRKPRNDCNPSFLQVNGEEAQGSAWTDV